MDRIIGFLARRATLLAAVGLAGVSELLFTVEWSFPTCGSPGYEPESAVYGFPFPYVQWGRVSSLEDQFVPVLYLANVATWALAWFLVVWALMRLCIPASARSQRASVASIGVLLCVVFGAAQLLLVGAGIRNPTSTLTRFSWSSYAELRPVGVGTKPDYDCTPINDEP